PSRTPAIAREIRPELSRPACEPTNRGRRHRGRQTPVCGMAGAVCPARDGDGTLVCGLTGPCRPGGRWGEGGGAPAARPGVGAGGACGGGLGGRGPCGGVGGGEGAGGPPPTGGVGRGAGIPPRRPRPPFASTLPAGAAWGFPPTARGTRRDSGTHAVPAVSG